MTMDCLGFDVNIKLHSLLSCDRDRTIITRFRYLSIIDRLTSPIVYKVLTVLAMVRDEA